MTESQLVNQIIEGLLYRGIFCWRNNNIPVFSQKQNCFRKLPKFTPKGVADILGLMSGKFLAIEVKIEKNKQTESQILFGENIKKNNGIYFVARCWEDVVKELKI